MNNFPRSLFERFSRLTYSQRFNVITLVFALPVIAAIPLFLNQLTRIDQYGHKELSGTLYLRPVWQLTEDLQSYVLTTQEFSAGNQQISELQKAQALVDSDLQVLEKTHTEYRKQLLPNETLDSITNQWKAVKDSVQSNNWPSFETQQVQLFKNLSDLTARVGDSSYL